MDTDVGGISVVFMVSTDELFGKDGDSQNMVRFSVKFCFQLHPGFYLVCLFTQTEAVFLSGWKGTRDESWTNDG